jgi:hypothetical protein
MRRLFMISILAALLTPSLLAAITVTAAPRTGSVRENGRWVFRAQNRETLEAASPRAVAIRPSQSSRVIAISALVVAIFAATLLIHLRRLDDSRAVAIFGLRAWDTPVAAAKS